jgi:hypothetical protein
MLDSRSSSASMTRSTPRWSFCPLRKQGLDALISGASLLHLES